MPVTETKTEVDDQSNPGMVTGNPTSDDERAPSIVTEESERNDDHPEVVTWPHELSAFNN